MSHNLLASATEAMRRLHETCLGFGNGNPPDQFGVLSVVNDLTHLYGEVSAEQARKFGGSQRKRLERKLEEAKQLRSFRDAGKTLGDSEREATLSVGEECKAEIDSLEEYEMYVAMMNALDRAARFGISAAAAVKRQESTASHQ